MNKSPGTSDKCNRTSNLPLHSASPLCSRFRQEHFFWLSEIFLHHLDVFIPCRVSGCLEWLLSTGTSRNKIPLHVCLRGATLAKAGRQSRAQSISCGRTLVSKQPVEPSTIFQKEFSIKLPAVNCTKDSLFFNAAYLTSSVVFNGDVTVSLALIKHE